MINDQFIAGVSCTFKQCSEVTTVQEGTTTEVVSDEKEYVDFDWITIAKFRYPGKRGTH